jgi:hypothetical protein
MSHFEIADAREFVVPIFDVEANGDGVLMETRRFRGTSFLVSPRGDVLTAAHVMPHASEIPQGRRLVAVVQSSGRDLVVWVQHAAHFEASDLALVKLNVEDTRFFQLSDEPVAAGEDVFALGITDHEMYGGGKEMRVLKGHVTLSRSNQLELSFAIPAGMSGCPVFKGTKVVAMATGAVESESLVDSREELLTVTPTKDILKLTEVRRVVSYGIATPLSLFKGHESPVLDNLTLIDMIRARGGSCG